ncbi:MAG: hypothetical protein V2A71_09295 [Candidatus Eisenbacteria bacterium]
MSRSVVISAAVEGIVDEAVVRKLIIQAGGRPGTVYGKSGKPLLRQKIKAYSSAAQYSPWIVLVDLDNDAQCAPPFCEEWLSHRAPHLCFRVAVREVEAWLMADTESLAAFLSVARRRIPADPEQLHEPKIEMVSLARQSRRRDIVEDMVPRAEGRRQVGPAYASRLVEYVQGSWRPGVAIARADSLRRAVTCLTRLVENVKS